MYSSNEHSKHVKPVLTNDGMEIRDESGTKNAIPSATSFEICFLEVCFVNESAFSVYLTVNVVAKQFQTGLKIKLSTKFTSVNVFLAWFSVD
jgi:hypothetical protein